MYEASRITRLTPVCGPWGSTRRPFGVYLVQICHVVVAEDIGL